MKHIESNEQKEVVKFLESKAHSFFAVPNSGHRNKLYAYRLRQEGVKAGVPDLIVITPPPARPNAKGTVIEMKKPKELGGSYKNIRPAQKEWLITFGKNGWICIVGFGAKDAIESLIELGY
jgi:hypothetical protein